MAATASPATPRSQSTQPRIATSDIGNAGNGGNVPNLQANEVIAAGKLYCRVRSQHTDEHWSVGETAALQAVSKNYNIDGMQLDAVTQAALEILCPEAGNGASR